MGPMSFEAAFGFTLQKLRLEKNLSQAELAKASQVDRTFISLMERGIRQPSLTTVFHLARALKLKPSELVSQVEIKVRSNRWKLLTK